MATCLLHVGMPKTGTSSIQDSLYFALNDPGFRYISLGYANSVLYLEPIFGEHSEEFWVFRSKGYSMARLRSLRQICVWRLRRVLRLARRRRQTPIISAERCWSWPAAVLERFRDFLAAEGFTVRVIAYVRPIKSWFESFFQQQVKFMHQLRFDPAGILTECALLPAGRWQQRLENLEAVFGRSNLVVRPYRRSTLVGGCAVLDFCATAGICFDPSAVIRSNESISADVVRLLYAHGQFIQPRRGVSFQQTQMLIRRFQRMPGERFHFHSAVFAPVEAAIDAQVKTLRDRWGIDLAEDLRSADGGPCLHAKADLFRYTRASLDWLAAASGSQPIEACEGEAAAREVAVQVERIRRRPSLADRRWHLMSVVDRSTRWLRQGD